MISSIYSSSWTPSPIKNIKSNSEMDTTAVSSKLLLQPDIILVVGSSQDITKFATYRFVLCNYSAYFRTLLAAYKGPEVRISNIDSRTFSSLLKYMYTGHLDLNPLNVYDIFLAGNLLHINDVSDQCKLYLREHHYRPTPIVKPIPCKTIPVTDISKKAKPLKYQPLRINENAPSIFKPVGHEMATFVEYEHENETHHITNTEKHDKPKSGETSLDKKCQKPAVTENHTTNQTNDKQGAQLVGPSGEQTAKLVGPLTNQVIMDVACCDGPVRFRKVLNKFYNPDGVLLANDDKNHKHCSYSKHTFKKYRTSRKDVKNNQHHNYNENQNINLNDYHTQIEQRKVNYKRVADHFYCPTAADNIKGTTKQNVSFYSCKICGSKFSSYYYVHKHRKLHHSQTMKSS